jgi:hypothetical protein
MTQRQKKVYDFFLAIAPESVKRTSADNVAFIQGLSGKNAIYGSKESIVYAAWKAGMKRFKMKVKEMENK